MRLLPITDEARGKMKCYAVIDTNVVGQNSSFVTGNKKHFPIHEFVVSPSEFIEIVEKNK